MKIYDSKELKSAKDFIKAQRKLNEEITKFKRATNRGKIIYSSNEALYKKEIETLRSNKIELIKAIWKYFEADITEVTSSLSGNKYLLYKNGLERYEIWKEIRKKK